MTENKEKNYMLIQDGCGACASAKEILKEPIRNKKLILVDVNTEKGYQLAEKHNIEGVPTIINEKNDFQQKCLLNKTGAKMYCDDGSERQLIKKSE